MKFLYRTLRLVTYKQCDCQFYGVSSDSSSTQPWRISNFKGLDFVTSVEVPNKPFFLGAKGRMAPPLGNQHSPFKFLETVTFWTVKKHIFSGSGGAWLLGCASWLSKYSRLHGGYCLMHCMYKSVPHPNHLTSTIILLPAHATRSTGYASQELCTLTITHPSSP